MAIGTELFCWTLPACGDCFERKFVSEVVVALEYIQAYTG